MPASQQSALQPGRPGRRTVLLGATGGAAGLLATACTTGTSTPPPAREQGGAGGSPTETTAPSDRQAARYHDADRAVVADGPDPAVALTVSRALFAWSTVAVVQAGPTMSPGAAAVAAALHVPLLAADPQLPGELDRLGVRLVLGYPSADGLDLPGRSVRDGPASVRALDDVDLVAPVGPPGPAPAVALAVQGHQPSALVLAALAAAGVVPRGLTGTDPRADTQTLAVLRRRPHGPVLGLGPGLGEQPRFAARVRTARSAPELPGGGVLPFPGRRFVAMYGHPMTAALGVLGEQGVAASVTRVRRLAEEYAPLSDVPVVPTFELIATVAAGAAGRDGNYSNETAVAALQPWVEAAHQAKTYVILDLQPGRSTFLEQATRYAGLLEQPWVGLALDPEWRLGPGERPLQRVGSVGVDEVNAVARWLAALVREHDLPPKVLVLHQFQQRMVRDRARLDTGLDEVQWVVHADGQGSQGAKQGTWQAVRQGLPAGVHVGWKNFVDEDHPMLTPKQTMAVRPEPSVVTYQ